MVCAGSFYYYQFVRCAALAVGVGFLFGVCVLLAWEPVLDRVCDGCGVYSVLSVFGFVLAADDYGAAVPS